MLANILLIIIGLAGGFSIAGGVFALITQIGAIPRIAYVTHTTTHVKTYEMAVLTGSIFGTYLTIFPISLSISTIIVGLGGLSAGVFVGCIATALAEALNVTAVFSRRLRLHAGLPWIVVSMSIGKVLGSLIYFYRGYCQ